MDGQWVFGGIERETGKIFMDPVEKSIRDIPIIKRGKKNETRNNYFVSDFWKSYDVLGEEGYNLKVNHLVNFKDPETGTHTNAIESS